MPAHRRSFRLILPRVQLRLIGSMAAVAALALLLEYTLLVVAVINLANDLPHDRDLVLAQAASRLTWILGAALAVLLPVLFIVAVLVSHRFCGPIYRFEKYLRDVLSGAERGECRLRQGDDLQELCDLINRSTAAARGAASSAPPAARDAA